MLITLFNRSVVFYSWQKKFFKRMYSCLLYNAAPVELFCDRDRTET